MFIYGCMPLGHCVDGAALASVGDLPTESPHDIGPYGFKANDCLLIENKVH